VKSQSNVRAHKRSALLTFLIVLFIADFVAGFVYGYMTDTVKGRPARARANPVEKFPPESAAPQESERSAAAEEPVKPAENPPETPDDQALDNALAAATVDSHDPAAANAQHQPKEEPKPPVVVAAPNDEGETEATPDANEAPPVEIADPPKPKTLEDPESDLYRGRDNAPDPAEGAVSANANEAKGDKARSEAVAAIRKWTELRSQPRKSAEARKVLHEARTLLDEALDCYNKAMKEDVPGIDKKIKEVNALRYGVMKSSGL